MNAISAERKAKFLEIARLRTKLQTLMDAAKTNPSDAAYDEIDSLREVIHQLKKELPAH